jgi:hypothetical protein
MSFDIASQATNPSTQPATAAAGKGPGKGAEGGGVGGAEKSPSTEFRDRLNNAGETQQAAQAQQAGATTQAQQTQQAQKLQQTNNTQQVNGQIKMPENQDLFGRFDRIRQDFDKYIQRSSEMDKLVAEGKLKPDDPKVFQQRREEMRMLLHFQNEMQGTAVQVEIASKVVEHATSGLKTMLQTPA